MQYIMAPLEEHFDDGFGAIGEAFFDAAKGLAKASGGKRIFWNHLPEEFLLRHAAELFLKSGIIIIHRKLKIPYDSEPHSSANPMLQTNEGKWKPLLRTHDLLQLYAYWKKLMIENKERLTEFTTHKPDMSVPKALDSMIDMLGTIDPSSDFFRYPISKNLDADKEKSPFKEAPLESLFPPEGVESEKIKALVLKNPKGEWVRAFKFDGSTHAAVSKAALGAANILNNFHAMMRIELTDGW
ncbi:MAG: hypothetical protein M1453_00370 [Acidobacteria bacterium]|nr:hypothetical protein [Acidobacteriota bacterium]MCL5286441.1 hypothetical protein [Acidobacteriota bacterium]